MHTRQVNYEKVKISSTSGMHKTIYHNGSHLLLFGKKKLQRLEISCE